MNEEQSAPAIFLPQVRFASRHRCIILLRLRCLVRYGLVSLPSASDIDDKKMLSWDFLGVERFVGLE